MNMTSLIFSFIGLMVIICGILAFMLRWFLFSSTESSVRRLDEELERKQELQIELGKKLKQVDEELDQKRKEARELSQRMHNDAEQSSKEKREEIIAKARQESEEILIKAKESTEKMKRELEKELDIRAVGMGMNILSVILSQKSQGALDQALIEEFIENLKVTDTSHINQDIKEVDVITLNPIDETYKITIGKVLKEKVGRELTLKLSTDPEICGGVVLKFGSLALDGSLKNLMRETALSMKSEMEAQKV
ncbi:MAG: F0F1 ATP synthase subunit delta [Candidatus Omnitrophica bacterium]|nr:F0F1 ATP synthase subunit delta [Candidatus Omnitrophota bacterium]